MHKISTQNLIFFFILQLHLVSVGAQVKTCKLGTLGGFQPQLVCKLNDKYFFNAHRQAASNKFYQKLLLYGPSGNGKSFIAQEFAKAAGATFNSYSGPSIGAAFQGSGVQKIIEIFAHAKKSNTLQVIFIDKFDAIASDLVYQQFKFELDAIKDNPKIFVICAASSLEKIPSPVLRRFTRQICEIKNPDARERKCLITTFYFEWNQIKIDIEHLNELINKANLPSNEPQLNASLHSIITELKTMQKFLDRNDVSLIEVNEEIKRVKAILEESLNYILKFCPIDTQSNYKEFKELQSALESSLRHLKMHNKKLSIMNANTLEYLIQKTENLNVRILKNIFKVIKNKMDAENPNQINSEDIDSILARFSHIFERIQHLQNQKKEIEKAKERQRIEDQNRILLNKFGKLVVMAEGGAIGLVVAHIIEALRTKGVSSKTICDLLPWNVKTDHAKPAASIKEKCIYYAIKAACFSLGAYATYSYAIG